MLLEDFNFENPIENPDELLRRAIRFTRRHDFEVVTVIAVQDFVGQDTIFSAVDNVPNAALTMQEDVERGRRCPVMQHCKRSHLPIAWDRATYERAGKGLQWEHQAQFGFKSGIAVAMHLPRGKHLMVGIDRDGDLPKDVAKLTRMAADLQLFTSCALDSAIRALLPHTRTDECANLTPRELETLRWTMEGKTAWELGCILGISEQTAARHINNASQKLGCVNKMQAVMKALRLHLIQ